MKKGSTLGELLYIISNFEKGRIKPFGIWNQKYKKSFNKSLEIICLLVKLISTDTIISKDEFKCLQDFICQNVGIIFVQETDYENLFDEMRTFNYKLTGYDEIMKLMRDIVYEIQKLLISKPNKYKIKILYLLGAFHNLPKVFLNPKEKTIYNLKIPSIDLQESIQYANSYLLLKNKV